MVDERSNSSQVRNHSLSPGTIQNNRPEQIYYNERDAEAEDENYDDYLDETEVEDPELIRNRETVSVQRVSKEKIINETTIFHSGETNGTDYPDYNYYDYYYDNDTNFGKSNTCVITVSKYLLLAFHPVPLTRHHYFHLII